MVGGYTPRSVNLAPNDVSLFGRIVKEPRLARQQKKWPSERSASPATWSETNGEGGFAGAEFLKMMLTENGGISLPAVLRRGWISELSDKGDLQLKQLRLSRHRLMSSKLKNALI
jgi:hypothetical protein